MRLAITLSVCAHVAAADQATLRTKGKSISLHVPTGNDIYFEVGDQSTPFSGLATTSELADASTTVDQKLKDEAAEVDSKITGLKAQISETIAGGLATAQQAREKMSETLTQDSASKVNAASSDAARNLADGLASTEASCKTQVSAALEKIAENTKALVSFDTVRSCLSGGGEFDADGVCQHRTRDSFTIFAGSFQDRRPRGCWERIGDRSGTFTKKRADTWLKLTYHDTVGSFAIGNNHEAGAFRIDIDGVHDHDSYHYIHGSNHRGWRIQPTTIINWYEPHTTKSCTLSMHYFFFFLFPYFVSMLACPLFPPS